MSKVAIITGGASGIGLAVATALLKRSEQWSVHIIDLKPTEASSAIEATFHRCSVTDYIAFSSTFNSIYQQHHRIDFVHANAGILETGEFSDGSSEVPENSPPPPPDMTILEVNLKAVATTSWLAMHYFRLTRKAVENVSWEGNLVMTASVVGLYASFPRPLYSATKYGVIGLTRSMAPQAKNEHSVRINCICPGAVRTAMMGSLGIPEDFIRAVDTPIEHITGAVMMLIEGRSATDAVGVKVEDGKMYGRAIEISRDWWRFREMNKYPDDMMGPLVGDVWGVNELEART